MMLPNANAARVDIAKLREYVLNTANPRGRHKARVLRSALGISPLDAEWLREQILRQLPFNEAIPLDVDEYGARFRVDMVISRLDRQTMLRTGWLVEPHANAPRLVTCWVHNASKTRTTRRDA